MSAEKMEGDIEKSTASGSGKEAQQPAGAEPKNRETTSGSRTRDPTEIPDDQTAAEIVAAATLTTSLLPREKLHLMLMLLMRTLEQRLHCVNAKAIEFLASDEVSSRLGIPGGSAQESEASSTAGSEKEKGVLERLLQAVDLLNVMDKSRSRRLSVFDKIRSQIDVMSFSSDEVSDQEEKEDAMEIFKILREKAWETLFDAFGIKEKPAGSADTKDRAAVILSSSLSPREELQLTLMLLAKELYFHLSDALGRTSEFLSMAGVSSRQKTSAGPEASEASSPAGLYGEEGILEGLLQVVKRLNVINNSRSSSKASLIFDKILRHTNYLDFVVELMTDESDDDVSETESMKQEAETLLKKQEDELFETFKILREKARQVLQDAIRRNESPRPQKSTAPGASEEEQQPAGGASGSCPRETPKAPDGQTGKAAATFTPTIFSREQIQLTLMLLCYVIAKVTEFISSVEFSISQSTPGGSSQESPQISAGQGASGASSSAGEEGILEKLMQVMLDVMDKSRRSKRTSLVIKMDVNVKQEEQAEAGSMKRKGDQTETLLKEEEELLQSFKVLGEKARKSLQAFSEKLEKP